ncbi:MAG: valine--tRNA ligase, partial [Nitrospinota bacterium]
LEGYTPESAALQELQPELADRWIQSRLQRVIDAVRQALEAYAFNEAAHVLYHFVWHELCDWYIELVKLRLEGRVEEKETARQVLFRVLETTFRLLHPFMPFVTEELWQHLPHTGESIMIAPYPEKEAAWVDQQAEQEMQFLQAVITGIRNIRGEMNLAPSQKITALINAPSPASRTLLQNHASYISHLALVESLSIGEGIAKPPSAATAVVGEVEIYVPLAGLIDFAAEERRLRKELARVEKDRQASGAKLANTQFLSRAPAEVITKEREKYQQLEQKYQKLVAALQRLAELQ